MLLYCHIFVNFPNFLWLFISKVIAVWIENIHCIILILLNLLRLVLWSQTWSILENASCTLEKYVFSAVIGWSILYMSVRTSWFYCFSTLLFLCWSSVYLFCYWSGALDFFNCYCWIVYFSFQFCLVLLHVFWDSVVRYTHDYNRFLHDTIYLLDRLTILLLLTILSL